MNTRAKKRRDIMMTSASERKHRKERRMTKSADLKHLEAPEWLDDTGRKYWEKFADLVYRAGVSTEMDYFSFETLVLTYREIRKLQRDVVANGYSTLDGKSRPEVAALQSMRVTYLQLLKDFGMTPKGRGVVAIPTGKMNERAKPGDEIPVEGFGKFKVIEGGGAINKHEQRLSDRKRNIG